MLCCTAWLCSGCGSTTLAEREIIRAVMFAREETTCQALLLTADKESQEGKVGYQTTLGEADTFAKALYAAENQLKGTPFYGLMDQALLPGDADWETVQEIGLLLYDKAQPAPEIAVLLWQRAEQETPELSAQATYEAIRSASEASTVHCGLQMLFAQNDQCAVPVWQQGSYGWAALKQGELPLRYEPGLQAQLGLLLSGQSHKLQAEFADGNAACKAQAMVQPCVTETEMQLQLNLNHLELTDLTGQEQEQERLQHVLEAELHRAMQQLDQQLREQQQDPFRLAFWQQVTTGETTASKPVTLQIQGKA